jgi:uncharacterized protein with HEPN domain
MRSDRERLLDALDAIRSVEEKTVLGADHFFSDEMVQVWVIHHLEIVGEAVSRLSQDIRQEYPDVPWSRIVAMRNILVHHYFSVDSRQVWNTVVTDLPTLKGVIETIIQSLPE